MLLWLLWKNKPFTCSVRQIYKLRYAREHILFSDAKYSGENPRKIFTINVRQPQIIWRLNITGRHGLGIILKEEKNMCRNDMA